MLRMAEAFTGIAPWLALRAEQEKFLSMKGCFLNQAKKMLPVLQQHQAGMLLPIFVRCEDFLCRRLFYVNFHMTKAGVT